MENKNKMPINISEKERQEKINEARTKSFMDYEEGIDVKEWKERIEKERETHDAHSERIIKGEPAFPSEDFEKSRAEAIEKYAHLSEAITANVDKEEILVLDVGSGKQYINRAIFEAMAKKNLNKKMKFIGFDQADKAIEKTSYIGDEKIIEHSYGVGEALPVKNESADVVKFDFTLQGASDEKIKALLSEAKSILKEGGIITVIDHLKQENPIDDMKAKIQNKILNKGMSEFREAKNQKEWEEIFKDNGLEIKIATPYREDGEISEDKPAQFILFVLKKVEEKITTKESVEA